MDIRIERNENYAPGDARANYFLMAGPDCIGGIDTHSGEGLIASIHIPSMIDPDGDEEDEDNWTDCTVVARRIYKSESDLDAVKADLLRYAKMAVASGELKPRTQSELDENYAQALKALWGQSYNAYP